MTQVRFTTTGDTYTVEESERGKRTLRLLPDDDEGKLLLLDRSIFQRMKEAGVIVRADAAEVRERWEL